MFFFVFFTQKTAYDVRISDWSSDVCSSDLVRRLATQSADKSPAPYRPDRDPYPRRLPMIDNRPSAVRGGGAFSALARDSLTHVEQIGRASCRERVCQYV